MKNKNWYIIDISHSASLRCMMFKRNLNIQYYKQWEFAFSSNNQWLDLHFNWQMCCCSGGFSLIRENEIPCQVSKPVPEAKILTQTKGNKRWWTWKGHSRGSRICTWVLLRLLCWSLEVRSIWWLLLSSKIQIELRAKVAWENTSHRISVNYFVSSKLHTHWQHFLPSQKESIQHSDEEVIVILLPRYMEK